MSSGSKLQAQLKVFLKLAYVVVGWVVYGKEKSNSTLQDLGESLGQAGTQRTTTEVPSNTSAPPDLAWSHGY